MIKKTFAILLLLFGVCSVCATEQTNYPYWIEDNNGNYNIWTKVLIPANGEKTIYIKKVDGYIPNGNDVFEFFEGNEITVGENQVSHTLPFNAMNHVVEFNAKYNNDGGYIGLTPNSGNYQGANLYLYPSEVKTYDGSHHTILSNPTYPLRASIKLGETQPTYTITDLNGNSNTITVNYRNGAPSEIDTVWCGYTSSGTWSYTIYWIAVRKYADQEPTVSVEQVDANTWKITLSNPNNYDLTDFQVKINGNGIVSSKTDSLLLTDNIDTQYIILSAPNIWNINTPVNATVSGYNISQGTPIYLDWGDGVIDNQIYNGEDLSFQHTYAETGTYTIKSYVNTYITTEKQIIITENLTTGILTFKPLYENTTITGWAIVNGMNVSMENNTTLYGILGKPVKIQTDKGYITSIPFSTNMTAYIAGSEYQYITVSLSADNPITVKNGEKVVGYGKNVYITQPVGDTITVWCNNKKIREYLLRSSIDDYIYIPKQHITANIRENNGILAVYLETWRKEKLHINIQKEDTTIYETEGYYEGFQRIDTGITPEAGNTYKLTILNEDGDIVSYSTYTYSPETQKPDIPENEGYIWIAFIIGVIIMIMGVISDNLPIALLGIGLFVLLVPYRMPYLDHLAAISTALAIIIIISRHIKRNAGD